jgi:hypothetical protein
MLDVVTLGDCFYKVMKLDELVGVEYIMYVAFLFLKIF